MLAESTMQMLMYSFLTFPIQWQLAWKYYSAPEAEYTTNGAQFLHQGGLHAEQDSSRKHPTLPGSLPRPGL